MKNILLASTALVTFAGAAAAEGHTSFSFGGEASAEYNSETGYTTDAELTAAETAADAAEALAAVHASRRQAYGSVESQLDMQYHDNVDGTTTWKDHVAKVKTDNPKS